jgi:hypothetical protein
MEPRYIWGLRHAVERATVRSVRSIAESNAKGECAGVHHVYLGSNRREVEDLGCRDAPAGERSR